MKLLLIGLGRWGKNHLKALGKLASELYAVDSDPGQLKACESFSIPKDHLSTDYHDFLDRVDGVDIVTPADNHLAICKDCFERGKDVFVEKPIALTSAEAKKMIAQSKERGLILQVGHIFRFNNALKMMRDLIELDYFGNLYYLKLQWTTLAPSPLNRDIIFDLGPHPVDIMNYVLKKWPSKVTCKARAYRRKMLEELAYFMIEFDDDLLAQVELSWLQPGKVRRLDVIGSERSATVDCLEQSIGIYENGDGDTHSLQVIRNNTIFDEVQHFADSILTAENSDNPGNVGAKNVAVLESLKRSLEENRTVKVDLRD